MRYGLFGIMFAVIAFASACETSEVNNNYYGAYGANNEEVKNSDTIDSIDNTLASTDEFMDEESVDYGGGGVATSFKVPLDPEYEWQVTQSWASHCKVCNNKGYGKNDGTDNDICMWSHTTCEYCKYGWDFSLPGNKDEGKSVLATAEGTVKKAGSSNAWGNYVVINHGNNVCSRYAHMQDNSVTVKNGDGICQGLIIGKIGNTGTGSTGPHLHFQFENCKDSKPIFKFFTDGNGVPMCVIGKDIYDSKGKYNALKLTNKPKEACDSLGEFAKKKFNNGATLPVPGLKSVSCGSLPNCPLITSCNATKSHVFSDDKYLTSSVRNAAQYLYGECAINGKNDGGLHQSDIITNAEGLKIAMYLFGQVSNCGSNSAYVPFPDVKTTDWYYPLVLCGLQNGIVDNGALLFWANSSLSFETAAKYLVKSAEKAGVIKLKNPSTGSFSKIPYDHSAYKYVETLYAYGAIDTNLTSYYAETSITRGQFVRMAANLSPCYCDNISCDGGCKCNQENFACASSGSGSDVGGGGGSGSAKLKIECEINTSGAPNKCLQTKMSIKPLCTVTNIGTASVGFKSIKMHLSDANDFVQCKAWSDWFSFWPKTLQQGEKWTLPDSFGIDCYGPPADGKVDMSFDYMSSKDDSNGQKVWVYNAATTSIALMQKDFDKCGKCTPWCSIIKAACGPDGCGGTCGSCPFGYSCNTSGQCLQSYNPCNGKTCGLNEFGASCGTCNSGSYCTEGQCKCLPNCNGKSCGPDGCGGMCGSYSLSCNASGKCYKTYKPCPFGLSCNASGQCSAPSSTCKPRDCTGILCGPDGCGGTCNNCKNGLQCKTTTMPNNPAKYFFFCGLPSK